MWNFDNGFTRTFITVGVDDIHLIIRITKIIIFLVLGEGRTNIINNIIGTVERKFSINFTKGNTKFL